jgi:RNA polymerase sigma-70 factor (ECF subfamily)
MKNQAVITPQLIQKVLEDDPQSSRQFIQLSQPFVYGALQSFDQLSQEDKEDIFQKTFVKLFNNDKKHIRNWNQTSKFTTYLYLIVTNLARDFINSAYYKRVGDVNSHDGLVNVENMIHFNDASVENVLSVEGMLEILNDSEKEVVEMYYYDGYNEREIAEELEKSINTISSLKSRALKKMRKYMQEIEAV